MLVQRQEKLDPAHEVRRDDLRQHASFVMRLAHEPDVAEAQVAETAVDELRRRARRPPAKSSPRPARPQARPGGVGGDGSADDPSSDDEQVEAPGRELLDRSIAGVHPWIVPQL